MKHLLVTFITLLLAIQTPVQCAYSLSELPSHIWSKLPRTVQAAIPLMCAIPTTVGLYNYSKCEVYEETVGIVCDKVRELIGQGIITVPVDKVPDGWFVHKVIVAAIRDDHHILRSYIDPKILELLPESRERVQIAYIMGILVIILAWITSLEIYNSDKSQSEALVNQ